MSQLSRTIATAASSFASKRHYAARMPALTSPPSSPSSPFFLCHARTPSSSGSSQTQMPSPPIAPRSPSQMQYPGFPTPPRSPSQALNPFFANQPLSPTQMQFSFGSPMLQAQQSLGDFSLNCMQAIPAASMAAEDRPIAGRAPVQAAGAEEPKKKRGLNAFTYYRKTFPTRYPAINRAIRTQKDRSTITGACWQEEREFVKDQCRTAVQPHDRTVAEAERLEIIRQNVSNKRKKERAASGTDMLRDRNLLLYMLWKQRASEAEVDSAIGAYDSEHPEQEPSRKRRKTKTVRDESAQEESAPIVLLQPTAAPSPLTMSSSHPSPSPATTWSSLPVSPAPPSSLALSPASSISSLPSIDMFAPQLPFSADFASAHWEGLTDALFAEQSALALSQPLSMSFEDQPPVHAYVQDLASNFDVTMQMVDAGFVANADAAAIVLGGVDNLDNLCANYLYPEHYGRPPADTLPTEEDNGPYFDAAFL